MWVDYPGQRNKHPGHFDWLPGTGKHTCNPLPLHHRPSPEFYPVAFRRAPEQVPSLVNGTCLFVQPAHTLLWCPTACGQALRQRSHCVSYMSSYTTLARGCGTSHVAIWAWSRDVIARDMNSAPKWAATCPAQGCLPHPAPINCPGLGQWLTCGQWRQGHSGTMDTRVLWHHLQTIKCWFGACITSND